MFAFFWLMLLFYSSLVTTQDLSHDYVLQGKNIIILAGQSNMSGRGGVINNKWDGFVPLECHRNSSILRLSAGLTWEEAEEPLHRDIDVVRTCGVGPGMAFANSVLAKDPSLGVIGLVPCAIGGTNISEWRRGSVLYNKLIQRANAALQGGGIIRALLWYQGESDTVIHKDAELYKGRLDRFFDDLRSDLMSPILPVIQVALASGKGPFIEIIRKAQLETNLQNVKCVDAKGLPLEPDELHLTTLAQVELGKMLADAFLQTVPLPVQSNAPKRFNNFILDFLREPFW
ncbi:unnamed protein product [Fraxinus pennsylvanica]|uniref:Sialate O-acetylesterase domain-containing protein n=1 Tax=Fraxinus pennsylvanica TaxID=56036 RepID=A0AAD2ADR9_9LAMI|nr:unnamed protein product [Fraxinus pennsylvanica]